MWDGLLFAKACSSQKKVIHGDIGSCDLCLDVVENAEHVLVICSFAIGYCCLLQFNIWIILIMYMVIALASLYQVTNCALDFVVLWITHASASLGYYHLRSLVNLISYFIYFLTYVRLWPGLHFFAALRYTLHLFFG